MMFCILSLGVSYRRARETSKRAVYIKNKCFQNILFNTRDLSGASYRTKWRTICVSVILPGQILSMGLKSHCRCTFLLAWIVRFSCGVHGGFTLEEQLSPNYC